MAAPERWHATLTMQQGTFEQGWDGKSGWRKFGGHAMPLESIAEARREAQFAPPLTMAKLLTGAKVVADRAARQGHARTSSRASGRAARALVARRADRSAARMTMRQPTPAGDLPEQHRLRGLSRRRRRQAAVRHQGQQGRRDVRPTRTPRSSTTRRSTRRSSRRRGIAAAAARSEAQVAATASSYRDERGSWRARSPAPSAPPSRAARRGGVA